MVKCCSAQGRPSREDPGGLERSQEDALNPFCPDLSACRPQFQPGQFYLALDGLLDPQRSLSVFGWQRSLAARMCPPFG